MAKLGKKRVQMKAYHGAVSLERNEHGIPVIEAGDYHDLLYGLGWAHARDRLIAMELTRLIGKGIAAENLEGSPELIEADRTMRRYGLWNDAVKQAGRIEGETGELAQAYCDGVNRALGEWRPFEFRMIKHHPGEWTPADSIVILKMMGLVDLAETQGWMEKFIIQMIKNGVALDMLKEMFPYLMDQPDPEFLDIIRRVKMAEPIVPPTVEWSAIPRLQSSNNWAVAGSRTASGEPILCGDPHLDTSRLPAIWYEVIMRTDDFRFAGCTVPGIPAPALGRTGRIAWSPTYGCMDVSDYFIEEVRDGKYRRGGQWHPFEVREETIEVKGGDPVTVRFYHNDHGVLEEEPDEDGYYLCFAYSSAECGADDMVNMMGVARSGSVSEAMGYFSLLDFGAFSWVVADGEGNIGLQMSGPCPVRPEGVSGLLPLPGWDEDYDWKGFHQRDGNPALYNPEEGYIATANQDLNHCAKTPMLDLPMADDRAARIAQLLGERDDHTVEDMKRMHYDLYARQAAHFMEIIRPLLPDTEKGNLLKGWECRYDSDSAAPTLFESVYRELLLIVFGEKSLGKDVMRHLVDETIIPYIFYGSFDRVLLSDESTWFGDEGREDIYRRAIERGLDIEPVPYGSTRKIMMANILLGGRLPSFLGFDYGPIELAGSRSTITQGQIFTTFGGRKATFSPTYRFATDFSEDEIHSCLAGGPSDRRFSRWYTYGIEGWLKGDYKTLPL